MPGAGEYHIFVESNIDRWSVARWSVARWSVARCVVRIRYIAISRNSLCIKNDVMISKNQVQRSREKKFV